MRPFVQAGDERLELNLNPVIKNLARSTPNETAYLLKQVLADTSSKDIERQIGSIYSTSRLKQPPAFMRRSKPTRRFIKRKDRHLSASEGSRFLPMGYRLQLRRAAPPD